MMLIVVTAELLQKNKTKQNKTKSNIKIGPITKKCFDILPLLIFLYIV